MNFIKSNIRTLVLVALFSASIFMAVAGGPVNPSPTSSLSGTVTLADPLPIADKYGRVESSQRYNAALASDAVTLLSSVCSFTPPCEIVFNSKQAYYVGDPDMASAAVQTMEYWGANTQWSINVSTASYNVALIGPSAVANVAITVHSLTQ